MYIVFRSSQKAFFLILPLNTGEPNCRNEYIRPCKLLGTSYCL